MRIRKSNSSGFTLIELLIVIIIIGILAAIAFVAYSSATNKAKRSDVQSAMATAGEKLHAYNVSNGYYPTDTATFEAWLESDDGGNSKSFSDKLKDFDGKGSTPITYTANDGAATPGTCDNTTTFCKGYVLTGDSTYWGGNGGTDDLSQTN